MRKHSANSFRPTLEDLQDRLVPSSVVLGTDGNIHVDGTTGADTVSVSLVGSTFKVHDVNNTTGVTRDTFIPVTRVTGGAVYFNGSAGGDRFDNLSSLRTVANGGGGGDTLVGSSGADLL